MGDKSSPAATGTFVFDLREIISGVRQEAEKRKADSPDLRENAAPTVKATGRLERASHDRVVGIGNGILLGAALWIVLVTAVVVAL